MLVLKKKQRLRNSSLVRGKMLVFNHFVVQTDVIKRKNQVLNSKNEPWRQYLTVCCSAELHQQFLNMPYLTL